METRMVTPSALLCPVLRLGPCHILRILDWLHTSPAAGSQVEECHNQRTRGMSCETIQLMSSGSRGYVCGKYLERQDCARFKSLKIFILDISGAKK